jgi:hypothetical protein
MVEGTYQICQTVRKELVIIVQPRAERASRGEERPISSGGRTRPLVQMDCFDSMVSCREAIQNGPGFVR